MGLQEDLGREPISRLRLRDPVVIRPTSILRAAVAEMRSRELGCAIVVDHDRVAIGIFTERSVLELLAQGVSLDDHVVRDYIESDFLAVEASEPILRVWDAVCREDRRFVCVVDKDGRPIGLTGQRGLAEYISEYFPRQVTVQRLGCKPWMQQREGA